MRLTHVCALSMAVAMGLAATPAHADKMTDAEELFRRGKALMAEHKDREACPLFEDSEKLDPQMGTLLNLAICHENVGRVASAWGEFRAVEQMAKAAGREDRIKLAHDRAAKLEPRLPRLKIVASPDSRVPGLAVKVDGEVKAEALWSGVAVDPGTVNVETSAPGKKTVTQPVKVDGEGANVTFTVPKLEDAPPEVVATTDPAAQERAEAAREQQYAANRSKRTKGFIVGGAGLAVAVAGGVFGVLAIMKNSDAKSACPLPCVNGSPQAGASNTATDRALLSANVANVAIPLGAVVALLGGYLVLSAGPTSGSKTSAFLAPRPGGADLGWSF